MDKNFEARLSTWKKQYSKQRGSYRTGVWANIDSHPLDTIFDDLADLYQNVPDQQRNAFSKIIVMLDHEVLDCLLYIRRIGLRLELTKQIHLFEYAIAITSLCVDFADPRDLLMSIMLLIYGAKKAGMNTENYINNYMISNDPKIKGLFNKAVSLSVRNLELTIEWFGPSEWKKVENV